MENEKQVAPAASATPAPASTPVKKSGSGLKIVFIIIIALVVLGAGGYVVYAKFIKKASFSSLLNPASVVKFNSDCKYKDPDLCKFINNWKEVEYMSMTGTDTTGGVTISTMFKMEGKTKSQMISSENGTEKYNMITIDKTTFTKDYTDNKWFKYTPPENKISLTQKDLNIDFDTKEDTAADQTTYKKIGTEACGKYTCFKYQVIDPAVTDMTADYIYFDNKEYLLRKTRTETKDGSVSEANYDYTEFTISEPSPTKEGNPYESASFLNSLQSSSTSSTSTPATVHDPYTPTGTNDASEAPDSTTPDTSGDVPLEVAPDSE